MVSAKYQAVAYKEIEAELTELEQAVFKRGRNAGCNVPKSATVQEYRCSTGFEALLGFLYLKKDFARLTALVDKTFLLHKTWLKNDGGCNMKVNLMWHT